MQERIDYGGWPNCIRICNSEIEIIVTTDVGPRIVRLGFINSQNFFYLSSDEIGKTGGTEWRIYGGHRLWLSPEVLSRTYYPDNISVHYSGDDYSIVLTTAKEITTGIVKEIEIMLSPVKNRITVIHRLINQNVWDIELSPWAISALSKGGRAIIPQEPFRGNDGYLLPERSMALWPNTMMNDIRWTWGNRYIQAKQDPLIASEQKIGVLNKQEWVAYSLNNELLIKRFRYNPNEIYPDFNCNNEIYINGNFLEIETLGPMTKVPPQGIIEHVEHWSLFKLTVGESEGSIDTNILPLINSSNIEF